MKKKQFRQFGSLFLEGFILIKLFVPLFTVPTKFTKLTTSGKVKQKYDNFDTTFDDNFVITFCFINRAA